MLADTARLVVDLQLKDGLTPGMARAEAGVRGFAASITTQLQRVRAGLDGAASHFRSRMGQIGSIAAGAGILGGAAALVKYSKDAIGAAEEWGRTTDRIRQLTGASTEEASRFTDAYEKLGIGQEQQIRIMGFLSKTLGNLNMDRKKARDLEREYGFDLVGTNGKVKNALEVTREFTGYFNDKHIPAYQKAALGAKLFGRGWTDMIPIFEQGQRKMDKALGGAMTMSDQQLKDLHRWRNAQRELNDTLGDTSVQVGLILVPFVTRLSKGLNEFVSSHQADIRQFFRDLLRTAEEAAGFIGGTVIPTISNLASSAKSFWDSIPGPLRDLLVKGIVADRAIKFLFGVSVTGVVGGAIKDAIGTVFGRFLGRGSSPANPMYVAGVGGGIGGAGSAAGGLGMLGKAALAVEVVGMAAAVWEAWNTHIVDAVHRNQTSNRSAAMGIVGEGRDKAATDIVNMTRLLREAQGPERVVIDTTSAGEIGMAMRNAADEIVKGSTAFTRGADLQRLVAAQRQAQEHGWTETADHIGRDIERLARKTPSAPQIGQAVADASGKGAKGDGDRELTRVMRHLAQVDSHRGNEALFGRSSDRLARQVRDALRTTGKDRDVVIRDTIGDLRREQRRALESGHTKLARNLGKDIDVLRSQLSRKQDTANSRLSTIANKDTSVTVNTTVNTAVSVRDTVAQTNVSKRYGFQAV